MLSQRSKLCCFILLISVLMLGLVPAYGAVQVTHLTNSSHGLGWLTFLEEQAEKFNELHPDIEIVVTQTSSYASKIRTMIVGGTAPEVTDFSPSAAAPFVRDYSFVDLNEFIARDDTFDPNSILDVAYEPITSADGALWALPMDIYPLVTYINKDVFDESGIAVPTDTSAASWNWDTVLSIAKNLTRFDNNGTAITYGIDYPDQRWQNFLVQAGGLPYDRMVEPTESRWNDPAVQEGIEWLRGLLIDHEVAPPRRASTRSQFRFWRGQSAMSLAYGPGMIGGAYTDIGFEYDVVHTPHGPANNGSTMTVNAFQILRDSANKEAAWEWIKFLTTNEEGVIRFMELTSRTPVLKSAQGLYPEYATSPPQSWLNYYEVAMNPHTESLIISSLNDRLSPFVTEMLDKVLLGQEAAGPALDELHRQATAVFQDAAQ